MKRRTSNEGTISVFRSMRICDELDEILAKMQLFWILDKNAKSFAIKWEEF